MTTARRGRGQSGDRSRSKTKGAAAALPREIVEDIRAAAGGKSNRAVDLMERAVGALESGRDTEAERAASLAKSQAPRSGAIREVLGLAHYRRGRFREALRELQAYRRLTGRADQNHLIADSHRALGAPEKAVEVAREAMRARLPAEIRSEAAVVAGAALADLGRYDEALTMLRRFDQGPDVARPHDLRVWYVMGDVLERSGRAPEAARAFRRIVEHQPDAFDAAERLARLS